MGKSIGCCGIFVVAFAGLAGSALAAAEPVVQRVEYAFERPTVSKVIVGGEEYDRVVLPGCASGGDTGQPSLPARGARILLPFGTEVSDIEVLPGEPVLLGDGYVVEPVLRPLRLSARPAEIAPPQPDPAIYSSPAPFPGDAFVEIGEYGFRGYRILTLKLHPVQYTPKSGELYYYPQMTVVVNSVEAERTSPLLRGFASDRAELAAKADTVDVADTYPVAGLRGETKGFDLLIITTPSLAAAFSPLKSYHDAHGITTEIRTTTDIGASDPASVRAYITDRYNNDGISYVIIGADDDLIPAPNLYVEAWAGGETETAMPGDVYFACLDGTWNNDGDSQWGEPTDGPGGGDVDLVADVYVGRASGGTTTEITRFVNKTLWYLNGGHTQLDKALMVGEYLGFGGASDYAAGMMEQLEDGSSADGYTTVGIPSSVYTIDELFERDMSWSQATIINRIDSGVHILNHLGHGSPDYAMKLYDSDVSLLSNTDLCFVYSQTCLAGHFDGTDCWAEYMNIKTDNGCFAAIMNARYGWGTENSTDGPNQRFNREFWDAVFDEGKRRLGPANHDSKEDNLYRVNQECMRWCYYEINLFGDPTVMVRGVDMPLTVSLPAGAPTVLTPGVSTDISVEIDPGDESYVPGSGLLYYRYGGGAYISSALVHQSGYLYVGTLPPAECGDAPEFYFAAEGSTSGVVHSPAGAPGAVYTADVGELTTVFADDFQSDQGWTVGDTGDDASTGVWNRMDPEGSDAQPENDHSSSPGTVCWVTDGLYGGSLGARDVDGGKTTLQSPVFDLSGVTDATISYYRWYSNDTGGAPNADVFEVDISDNGGASWANVETVGPSGAGTSGGWVYHEFSVSDFASLTANVKLRFVAADEGDGSLVEAALDDFVVSAFECEESATCSDGILNQDEDRIDCGGPNCAPCECASDSACDNSVYCDGAETCDAYGDCQASSYPCGAGTWCDENGDDCISHGNGDFGPDGDVDLEDFAAFQVCFDQPGYGACAAGNMTGTDELIDADDFAEFVTTLTGP